MIKAQWGSYTNHAILYTRTSIIAHRWTMSHTSGLRSQQHVQPTSPVLSTPSHGQRPQHLVIEQTRRELLDKQTAIPTPCKHEPTDVDTCSSIPWWCHTTETNRVWYRQDSKTQSLCCGLCVCMLLSESSYCCLECIRLMLPKYICLHTCHVHTHLMMKTTRSKRCAVHVPCLQRDDIFRLPYLVWVWPC